MALRANSWQWQPLKLSLAGAEKAAGIYHAPTTSWAASDAPSSSLCGEQEMRASERTSAAFFHTRLHSGVFNILWNPGFYYYFFLAASFFGFHRLRVLLARTQVAGVFAPNYTHMMFAAILLWLHYSVNSVNAYIVANSSCGFSKIIYTVLGLKFELILK